MTIRYCLTALLLLLTLNLYSQEDSTVNFKDPKSPAVTKTDSTKDSNIPRSAFVIWAGTKTEMTFLEIASYCAPVFWFSPDEPQLKNKTGKDIRIPEPFPFQGKYDKPVVYYQIREILSREEKYKGAVKIDKTDINNSLVDLTKLAGLNIDYSHYYEFEAGLGMHHHDTEQAQFNIYVNKKKIKGVTYFIFVLIKVTAKAHALTWYDNIFKIDTNMTEMKLPFHILVEEGKHASCTDINADGYYTPGYDVNVRTNDAWGVRDVIRTGELFSSGFASYMAKVRKPEQRIFPPLPEDSPLRERWSKEGEYSPDNAIYELRPMPSPSKAGKDAALKKDMSGYAAKKWPVLIENTNTHKFVEWWETDMFLKSFSVSAMYDKDFGISFAFPLLIVKNVEAPFIGGWMVNRIYLKDDKLRDFGYTVLLTPSASRFMDPYFAAGIEIDKEPKQDKPEEIGTTSYFVLETGIKFRANLKFSPLKFLTYLTDLWGVRLGIKNKGFPEVDHLQYNIEIGAGVW
ncbi:MAG: hypothetical protein L0Y76_04500 [Ignavibacteria bacterium]|nr:hypothetical protein [Ignavibacteria bacterium]